MSIRQTYGGKSYLGPFIKHSVAKPSLLFDFAAAVTLYTHQLHYDLLTELTCFKATISSLPSIDNDKELTLIAYVRVLKMPQFDNVSPVQMDDKVRH